MSTRRSRDDCNRNQPTEMIANICKSLLIFQPHTKFVSNCSDAFTAFSNETMLKILSSTILIFLHVYHHSLHLAHCASDIDACSLTGGRVLRRRPHHCGRLRAPRTPHRAVRRARCAIAATPSVGGRMAGRVICGGSGRGRGGGTGRW